MIRLSLGNVGSGKTACEVRNMILNLSHRPTYSNIDTKGIDSNIRIKPEMIIKKTIVGEKKRKSGLIEPVYKLEINKEFWRNVPKPIDILIDEAHTMLNPRRAMSSIAVCMTDFLSLIRRMLGSNDAGEGEAVFITQLPRRLDPILRDMANEVNHHICHYKKRCRKCNVVWVENSDSPHQLWLCPKCSSSEIKKFNFIIEIFSFKNIQDYEIFIEAKQKKYFRRYYITDIEKYFPYYNTLQWDDMFSEFY